MSLPDLLLPIRAAVEAALSLLHTLLTTVGFDPAAGLTWLLAVALLVVAVRAALLPLAVRQFRSGLRMRALAPEAARIRDRYRAGPTRRHGGRSRRRPPPSIASTASTRSARSCRC